MASRLPRGPCSRRLCQTAATKAVAAKVAAVNEAAVAASAKAAAVAVAVAAATATAATAIAIATATAAVSLAAARNTTYLRRRK